MVICCDINGNELDSGKRYYTTMTKSGRQWVPTFIEYVDPDRCIGCGLCVRVCLQGVYKMIGVDKREVTTKIKGKKRTRTTDKMAVVVNPDACLGDCHCHKILS